MKRRVPKTEVNGVSGLYSGCLVRRIEGPTTEVGRSEESGTGLGLFWLAKSPQKRLPLPFFLCLSTFEEGRLVKNPPPVSTVEHPFAQRSGLSEGSNPLSLLSGYLNGNGGHQGIFRGDLSMCRKKKSPNSLLCSSRCREDTLNFC